jgi:hypothetical protein
MRNGPVRIVAALAALLLSAACAPTTKMLTSWKAPTFREGSVKNVLVLGVGRDNSIRRLYEDSFVAALKDRGYGAVPSYDRITEPDKLDKEAFAAQLKQEGVTHVIATRVVDQKTIETYVPPTVMTVGAAPYWPGYYSAWPSYWSVGYTTSVSPGYVTSEDKYSLETNLYDVGTGELVWTGLSETWVSTSPQANVAAVIDKVVYELRSKKIL